LKIREWRCASCNSHHDRDVNASINLSRWVK
ncbi:transposase, partial [Bacillus cereus]|nr:transposase [Bacillus cereus]MCU5690086.1 transposase [Bacillus cereus]